MKWQIVFLLLFLSAGVLCSSELKIAENGLSNYQVVLPDRSSHPAIGRSLQETGALVVKCIRKASGADLPLTEFSARVPGKPAIFIGIAPADVELERWEYRIEAAGGNIYLYGNDNAGQNVRTDADYHSLILGSVKAAVTFLEKFAETAFVGGGEEGISVLPCPAITVPEDFSLRGVPEIFTVIRGQNREQGMFYRIANNMLPPPWYFTYGGHSYPSAVPVSLFSRYPDYFALLRGQRRSVGTSHSQYCISNPSVQMKLLAEMLRQLDNGAEYVQLAQSDGFELCECRNCRDLFGVEDTGEKLWILHRNLAQKALEKRPGKKVNILAYGPTARPPRTFCEFPANTSVELAPCDADTIAQWRNINVPQGFNAYLYNWGWYQFEGFTPKLSFDALANQAKLFRRNRITHIYCCGFGELPGMEGPAYYIWGKLLADPDADIELMLKNYCRHTFGKADGTMEQFFSLLNERMQRDLPPESRKNEWYSPELLDGKTPAMLEPLRLLAMRYPQEIITAMENLLKKAEKESSCRQLALIRCEFNYLRLTANAAAMLLQLKQSGKSRDFRKLMTALKARNRFISNLPVCKNGNSTESGRIRGAVIFGGASPAALNEGGRLLGQLRAPFNWEIEWMLDKKIQPVFRTIRTDGVPQQMIYGGFYRKKPFFMTEPTSVALRHDAKFLHVDFTCGNAASAAGETFQFQIKAGTERMLFSARGDSSELKLFKRTKTSRENNGRGEVYLLEGTVPGATVQTEKKQNSIHVRLSIPWKSLGVTPRSGLRLPVNASRIGRNGKIYIWEYNLNQTDIANYKDSSGMLILR